MRHRIRLFRSRTLSFVFTKDVDSVNLRSDKKVTDPFRFLFFDPRTVSVLTGDN